SPSRCDIVAEGNGRILNDGDRVTVLFQDLVNAQPPGPIRKGAVYKNDILDCWRAGLCLDAVSKAEAESDQEQYQNGRTCVRFHCDSHCCHCLPPSFDVRGKSPRICPFLAADVVAYQRNCCFAGKGTRENGQISQRQLNTMSNSQFRQEFGTARGKKTVEGKTIQDRIETIKIV